MSTSQDRAIGPIGTASRVVIGAAVIAVAIAVEGIEWWDLAAVLTVLPIITVGAALLARARGPAAATAVVIAAVAGLGTLLTFVTPVDRVAIFVFIGLTMLLAAIRGDSGCELLTVPNMIRRRRDTVWCPVYTPIDAVEAKRRT